MEELKEQKEIKRSLGKSTKKNSKICLLNKAKNELKSLLFEKQGNQDDGSTKNFTQPQKRT